MSTLPTRTSLITGLLLALRRARHPGALQAAQDGPAQPLARMPAQTL